LQHRRLSGVLNHLFKVDSLEIEREGFGWDLNVKLQEHTYGAVIKALRHTDGKLVPAHIFFVLDLPQNQLSGQNVERLVHKNELVFHIKADFV